jgi:CRP/FNR family transcriptional regulator, cyclic AMP receptor protein
VLAKRALQARPDRAVPEDPTDSAAVNLLRLWPELTASVAADERRDAERLLVAPLVTATGDALMPALAAHANAFAFVIARGVVFKETLVAARSSLELFTEGDVLAPLPPDDRRGGDASTSRYQAAGTASVAVLDQRFTLIARRWPEVGGFLHTRLAEQVHRASLHLATLHVPRAEERILALFIDLARRLGRVTPHGITIDLPLTHEVIGRLTGSRRPTVSLALRTLEADASLTFRDKQWLVSPQAWEALSHPA